MRPHRTLFLVLIAAGLLAVPLPASAHAERESFFPEPPGRVPRYRTGGPTLLVCKGEATLRRIERLGGATEARNLELFQECREDGFRNVQAAIDAVKEPGSRILILPGVYREGPTAGKPRGACAELDEDDAILTYRQHLRCPHNQNLIAILGDGPDRDRECDRPVCRLQIEGTGDGPEDVVIDNGFAKLNGIRADRADGVYFRNFTVQNAEFNSIYVIETDGFVIDRVVARWNEEYGFLTFSSDHGLYKNCEAYGNGDGGLYPGSAADLHGKRPSIEIRNCSAHHNLIGISGTAGNSVLIHRNRLYQNSTAITLDSFFPNHPGMPQDATTIRRNRIFSNNQNYYRYSEMCAEDIEGARERFDEGVVCPAQPVPVGTGILIAGGNANLIAKNRIYDNWRAGTLQLWIPAAVREDFDPAKQYDTSHFNRYIANVMGLAPGGADEPNGLDFWWDIEGEGNCWDRNRGGEDGISSDPPILPSCDSPSLMSPVSQNARFATCATWSREDHHPPGCDWMERPPRPE